MRRKKWIECRQSIDLLHWSSNMEIELYWYQNKYVSVWTYDLIDHLMVEVGTIIAFGYNDLYYYRKKLYELHPMDKHVSNNIINDE